MSITTIQFGDSDLRQMWEKLTDEQLIESIKESLGMTAQQIGIMCGKLQVAVERGINVDGILPPVIRRWYKHIAAGQVMAELVPQFLGNPSFIDRFARLPLPDADDHLRTPEEQKILLKQSKRLTLNVPNWHLAWRSTSAAGK
jgi:hypothetical protein